MSVSIVGGSGIGVFNNALPLSGQPNIGDNRSTGPNSGSVNIATGNLIVRSLDEHLSGEGADLTFLRTYNSQGVLSDGLGQGWNLDGEQSLSLIGVINTTGSTVNCIIGDGHEVVYQWNAVSNQYESHEGDGAKDFVVWDAGNNRWKRTDGSKRTTEVYDGNSGKLTEKIDSSGNSIIYDYDVVTGLLTSVTDMGNQQKIELQYAQINGFNRIQQINTFSLTNDANGQATTTLGSAINQVMYDYDTLGRLYKVTTDLSSDNSTADGNVFSVCYEYDASSFRITKITQCEGVVLTPYNNTRVEYSYEQIPGGSNYRIKTVSDVSGTQTYTYNTGSTTITNGVGQTWTYTYDANNQITQIDTSVFASTNQSITTQYQYDASGNVTQTTDGLGNHISYQYDGNDNCLFEQDALGNTIERTFNINNQLLTETHYRTPDADGPGPQLPSDPVTTRYVYDNNNRLRFNISAEGCVTEYQYNAQGQQTANIQYTFNTYAVGVLGSSSALSETDLTTWVASQPKDQIQLTTFNYDYRGNLSQKIAYASVDAAGNGVLDTAATVTQYIYDDHRQLLQTIAVRGSGRTQNTPISSSGNRVLSAYVYDGIGRVISLTNANGTTTTSYIANTSQRQISVSNAATGLTTTSAYDGFGRLLNVSQVDTSTFVARGTSYVYDDAGRLVVETDAAGEHYRFYDEANRVQFSVDATGATTEYQYNSNNQITTQIEYNNLTAGHWLRSLGGVNYLPKSTLSKGVVGSGADIITDLFNDRATQYQYDNAGRLIAKIDAANNQTDIAYDGLSEVTQTSLSTRTTRYFYDNDGNQIAKLDGEGYLTQYVYNAAGQLIRTTYYATATNINYRQNGSISTLLYNSGLLNSDSISQYYYYDAEGRQVGYLSEKGFLTETVYDEVNNIQTTYQYMNPVGATPSDTLASLKTYAGTLKDSHIKKYDTFDRLLMEVAADGTTTDYVYDTAGRLIRTIIGDNQTELDGTSSRRGTYNQYDAFGDITGTVSGVGEATLGLNPLAAAVSAAIAGYGKQNSYDVMGRLSSVMDANGNVTSYYYDEDSRLRFTVDAAIKETQYNTFGQISATIDYATPLDTNNIINLSGGGSLQSSDLAIFNSLKDPSTDHVNRYVYESRGLLTKKTDAEGNITNYYYDGFGQLINQVQSGLVYTGYQYDNRGKLIEIDYRSLGLMKRTDYDAFGRVITERDGVGNITRYQYNDSGRTVVVTDPLLHATKTEYDAFDRVLKSYDGNGNTTTYTYDDVSRSVVVTTPEGVSVSTFKSREGDVVKVIDGRGAETHYFYDASGQLISTKDVFGNITTNAYNNMGNLVSIVDVKGIVTQLTYSASGQVLTRTVDPTGLNLITQYTYDVFNQRVQIDEGVVGSVAARTTQYTYDKKGQLISVVTDPNGLKLQTRYTYDGVGNTLTVSRGSVSSPNQQVTKYTYGQLGERLTETVDPIGLAITTYYDYNKNNQVTRKTDASGNSTWYVYDADGQLTYTVNALGEVTQQVYDNNGNLVSVRHYANKISTASLGSVVGSISPVTSAADEVTYYSYDKDGHACYVLQNIDANNWTIKENQYDNNGNVIKSIAYDKFVPSSAIVNDLSDNLLSVSEAQNQLLSLYSGGNLPQSRITRHVYDANNRLRFTVDALGFVTENTYDAIGQVTSHISYTYELAGLQLSQLDAATQLTRETVLQSIGLSSPVINSGYVYDADGRLISQTDALGNVESYDYDSLGEQIKSTDKLGNIKLFSYDKAGRRTSTKDALNNTEIYQYDDIGNRIGFIDKLSNKWKYQYDKAGHRVKTTDPLGNTTDEIYSQSGQLVQTIDALGITTQYLYDKLGRVTQKAIDPSGLDLQTQYSYDVFGNQTQIVEGGVSGVAKTTQYEYDLQNHVTNMVVDPNGLSLQTQYSYNAFGEKIQIKEGAGATSSTSRITQYSYDLDGRLSTVVIDPTGLGLQTQYAYDGFGNVIQVAKGTVILPVQQVVSYVYDKLNRRIFERLDPSGLKRDTQYKYDAAGHLTREVDPNNNSTWYVYDSLGRVIYRVNASGEVTKYKYDKVGNLVKSTQYATRISTNGFGDVVTTLSVSATPSFDRNTYFGYDADGRVRYVLESADAVPSTWTLKENEYDGNGNVITTFEYDKITEDSALTTSLSDGVLTVAEIQNKLTALGVGLGRHKTQYIYDNNNRLRFTVDAMGYVVENVYDELGHIVSNRKFTTALTPTQRAQLDNAYKLTRAQLIGHLAPTPEDLVREFFYSTITHSGKNAIQLESKGLLTRSLGAFLSGDTITVTFWLKAVSGATSTVGLSTAQAAYTQLNVNGIGVWQKITLTYTMRHNDNNVGLFLIGNNTGSTSPVLLDDVAVQSTNRGIIIQDGFEQGITSSWYHSAPAGSAINNLVTEPAVAAAATNYLYDAAGRLVSSIDALGNSENNYYDSLNEQIRKTDKLGNNTNYGYDKAGRVISVTDALNNLEIYSYDALGNRIRVIDKLGRTWTYLYNKANELIQTIDPLNNKTINSYDNDGLLRVTQDARGIITRYSYDKSKRLIQKTVDPTGLNLQTQYVYDAIGQKTKMIEGAGTAASRTTQYNYDRQGQLILEIVDPNGLGLQTQYSYDGYGNVLTILKGSMAMPGLQITQYSYDPMNRKLSETIDPNGLALQTLYSYDGYGNIITQSKGTKTTPNQQNTQYSYNLLNQKISEVVDPNGLALTTQYKYDANGNVTRKIDANGNSTWYVHDKNNRQQYIIDALGEVVENKYTSTGKIASVRRYAKAISTTNLGDVISSISLTSDATDHVIYYALDNVDRIRYELQSVDDNNWVIKENQYDANGNIKKTTEYDKFLSSTTLTSTLSDNVVTENEAQSLISGVGYTNSQRFDARETRYIYDADNRLRFTIDALGYVTENIYDELGKIVSTIKRDIILSSSQISQIDTSNSESLMQSFFLDNIHTGNNAVAIDVGASISRLLNANGSTFLKDDVVTLVVWLKAEVGAKAKVTLNDSSVHVTQQVVSGNGNWQKVSLTFKLPQNDNLQVSLYGDTSGLNKGLIQYDDLVVQTAKNGLVFQDGFEQGANLTLQSTVTTTQWSSSSINNQLVTRFAHLGAKAVSVSNVGGTTISRALGKFSAGDKVTATVWFKAKPSDTAYFVLRDNNASDTKTVFQAGNDGWIQLTVTMTLSQTDDVYLFLYGNAGGSNTAPVLYDDVVVKSFNKGKVFQDGFEGGLNTVSSVTQTGGWYVSGNPIGDANIATSTASSRPLEENINYVYDLAGRLISTINTSGNANRSSYDALNHKVSDTDKNGNITKYQYDPAGRLISTTDALGFSEIYTYDAVGNRTSFTNKLGNTWSYICDKAGRVIKEISPQVNVTSLSISGTEPSNLNSVGTTSTQKTNIITLIEYDKVGNVIARTEAYGLPEESKTSYEYDKVNRQVKTTLPGYYSSYLGVVLKTNSKIPTPGGYEYPFKRTIEVTYDSFGNAVLEKTAAGDNPSAGSAVTYIYRTKVYDKLSRVIYEVDRANQVTSYRYNALGDQTSSTMVANAISNSANAGTIYTYTSMPVVTSTANDREIKMDYDKLGRVTEIRKSIVSSNFYSSSTNTTNSQVSQSGVSEAPTIRYQYDAFDNVIKESTKIDSTNWQDTWHYYNANNSKLFDVMTYTSGKAYVTSFAYDNNGNLTSQTEYAQSINVNSNTIAVLSIPTASVQDRTTTFSYDAMNRNIDIVEKNDSYYAIDDSPLAPNLRYLQKTQDVVLQHLDYDAVGNIVKKTDQANNQTAVDYDAIGHVTKVTEPSRLTANASKTGSSVDPFKNQVQSTPTITYQYNALGQRISETYGAGGGRDVSSPATNVIHRYDMAGNEIATQDTLGNITTRTFDISGKLTSETKSVSVTFSDWSAGNYSKTITTNYSYDISGNLTSTYISNSGFSGNRNSVNGYNRFGELASVTTTDVGTNGLQTFTLSTYSYDNAGRLISNWNGISGTTNYFYDLAGHLTRKEELGNNSDSDGTLKRITENAYDYLGHALVNRAPQFDALISLSATKLTAVTPMITQTYDRWGNVLSHAVNDAAGNVTTYTYNKHNKVTSETLPSGVTVWKSDGTFSTPNTIVHEIHYDVSGNAVEDVQKMDGNIERVRRNVYDSVGELVQTIDATDVKTWYAYDAFGNRIGEKNGLGTVTTNSYDANHQLISHGILRRNSTSDANNSDNYYYSGNSLFSPEEVILESYKYDQVGHRVADIDALNNATDYKYDVYGNLIATHSAGGILKTFGYDINHNKTSETDALGNTLTWTYNIYGQLTTQKLLDNSLVTNTYNDFGQLNSETVKAPITPLYIANTTYQYAQNGLLLSKGEMPSNQASTKTTTSFQYDVNGHQVKEIRETRDGSNVTQTFEVDSTFDKLGRLARVSSTSASPASVDDPLGTLDYHYDEFGNRVQIIRNGIAVVKYSYDLEGRVTKKIKNNSSTVDVDQHNTIELTAYDLAGRKRFSEQNVLYFGTSSGHAPTYNQTVQNVYWYTDLDQLKSASSRYINHGDYDPGYILTQMSTGSDSQVANPYSPTDGFDQCKYDQRGLLIWELKRGDYLNNSQDNPSHETTYTYNSDGRITSQATRLNGVTLEEKFTYDTYDAVGNLLSYTYSSYEGGGEYDWSYSIEYFKHESYSKASEYAHCDVLHQSSSTTNSYDLKGRLISTRSTSSSSTGSSGKTTNYEYDANDNIILSGDSEGGLSQNIFTNNSQVARLGEYGSFDFGATGQTESLPNAPSLYVVKSNDTLGSIALTRWGDSSLWYLIADANGIEISSTADLSNYVGQSIRIPNVSRVSHNNSSTFTPYNAADFIGDTSPKIHIPHQNVYKINFGTRSPYGPSYPDPFSWDEIQKRAIGQGGAPQEEPGGGFSGGYEGGYKGTYTYEGVHGGDYEGGSGSYGVFPGGIYKGSAVSYAGAGVEGASAGASEPVSVSVVSQVLGASAADSFQVVGLNWVSFAETAIAPYVSNLFGSQEGISQIESSGQNYTNHFYENMSSKANESESAGGDQIEWGLIAAGSFENELFGGSTGVPGGGDKAGGKIQSAEGASRPIDLEVGNRANSAVSAPKINIENSLNSGSNDINDSHFIGPQMPEPKKVVAVENLQPCPDVEPEVTITPYNTKRNVPEGGSYGSEAIKEYRRLYHEDPNPDDELKATLTVIEKNLNKKSYMLHPSETIDVSLDNVPISDEAINRYNKINKFVDNEALKRIQEESKNTSSLLDDTSLLKNINSENENSISSAFNSFNKELLKSYGYELSPESPYLKTEFRNKMVDIYNNINKVDNVIDNIENAVGGPDNLETMANIVDLLKDGPAALLKDVVKDYYKDKAQEVFNEYAIPIIKEHIFDNPDPKVDPEYYAASEALSKIISEVIFNIVMGGSVEDILGTFRQPNQPKQPAQPTQKNGGVPYYNPGNSPSYNPLFPDINPMFPVLTPQPTY